MKRKYVGFITIFAIITISILAYFYLNYNYEKIDVYTAKNFDKEINTPIRSINDKKALKKISEILKESKKMPGVLDVGSPDYILEIYSFNENIKTVYLWVEKDSTTGMYTYKDNTETGYSISKTNTQKLIEIML